MRFCCVGLLLWVSSIIIMKITFHLIILNSTMTIAFKVLVRNYICYNLQHCLSFDACIVAGLESIPQGQGSKLE